MNLWGIILVGICLGFVGVSLISMLQERRQVKKLDEEILAISNFSVAVKSFSSSIEDAFRSLWLKTWNGLDKEKQTTSHPRKYSMGTLIIDRQKVYSEKMAEEDSKPADPDNIGYRKITPDEYVAPQGDRWNLVSSKIEVLDEDAAWMRTVHAPCIDFDFPVAVVQSKTPGHYHLYIEKFMSEHEYGELIETLYAVGLIGYGNYQQWHKTKATYLRRGPYETLISEQHDNLQQEITSTLLDWDDK